MWLNGPPPPQIMGLGIRKQEKIKKLGWDHFLWVKFIRFLPKSEVIGY